MVKSQGGGGKERGEKLAQMSMENLPLPVAVEYALFASMTLILNSRNLRKKFLPRLQSPFF
jgi:hypothetical protein